VRIAALFAFMPLEQPLRAERKDFSYSLVALSDLRPRTDIRVAECLDRHVGVLTLALGHPEWCPATARPCFP